MRGQQETPRLTVATTGSAAHHPKTEQRNRTFVTAAAEVIATAVAFDGKCRLAESVSSKLGKSCFQNILESGNVTAFVHRIFLSRKTPTVNDLHQF